MFTNEEYDMIVSVMSQLQFRAGQGEQLKLAESVIRKISSRLKIDDQKVDNEEVKK